MDITDEQLGFQRNSGSGGLENDNLTEFSLDEIFFNDNQIDNGYLEENGNVNFGFSAADQQHFSSAHAQVNQPEVMFCSGQRLLSDELGHCSRPPIDIPRCLHSKHQPLPLTPPYSDCGDSPMEEHILCRSSSSVATIDQAELAKLSGRDGQYACNGTANSVLFLPNTCKAEPCRKRRRTVDSDSVITNPSVLGLATIKTEPGLDDLCEDSDSMDSSETLASADMDTSYQCLKWKPFKQGQWSDLYDENNSLLPPPDFRVDADKGFNFSFADDAFVCQKKNHFQITVSLKTATTPAFIKVKDVCKSVDRFKLHLFGIKMESQGSSIKIEQSQADRSKRPYDPPVLPLTSKDETKLTVGRLHFSETTSNNMRKKGKPNPDQRYFNLVVAIYAYVKHESFLICGSASERIIVRASNPGQFENDVEVVWSRGFTADSVFRMGRVGINTDRPDESLSVHGNMKLTGHMVHPSDIRVKENIIEIDTREQLRNVSRMKLYRYSYSQDYLEVAGLNTDPDTGVLAQEVKEVLPDAVRESEDLVLADGKTIEKLLVVNKERIFMENVGAVKELCKLTDNLETRIDELELVSKKLQTRRRADTTSSCYTVSSLSRTSSICSKKSTSNISTDGERRPPHTPRHHCQHKHHTHNCHQQKQPQDVRIPVAGADEQTWCSPRFMQFLIVILVLVMCLSVAAMATLYAMQDKDRDSSPRNSFAEYEKPLPTLPLSPTNTTTGRPRLSTVPPEASTPTDSFPKSPTSATRKRPSEGGDALTEGPYVRPGTPMGTGSQTSAPLGSDPYLSKTPTSSINRCKCCGHKEKCGDVPSNVLTGKAIYYDMNNIPQPQGTKSSTPEFDFRIIDKDFDLSCDDCCSRNSSFYVPYSAAIPFQPITIELNSTFSTKMLLCSTSTSEGCPEPSAQPTQSTAIAQDIWSTSHRWQLSSAYYFWSSYHFRIILPSSNTSQPSVQQEADCFTKTSDGSFHDYYLYFIRICV
ncbi:myelin regulatory factor [Nematostella vectensis]|uniref:myelin regulatory factor n=1 Tax=Nematostella vectensis TaxID=45351 RepID=UPI0020772FB5|nr:myelin regulatory factor [Nematostella vectensis]